MQWLNTVVVCKFFGGQTFPGKEPFSMQKEPTESVPFVSANPDELCPSGMIIPKPDAWTSSVPSQDMIDVNLT